MRIRILLLLLIVASAGADAQRSASMREVNEVAKPGANQTIAISGATLIDGRGGPPVNDAIVIVRGEKILAAGARAAVTIPKEAAIERGERGEDMIVVAEMLMARPFHIVNIVRLI
ncbi:MAG: hypothetical protein J2P52_00565 [Blastocatellia bacterium]|nr:hypothetical protein [Blastocatellia bacterium]